jgi:hypothetical protein
VIVPDSGEIRYFVLADRAVPYLLARVRWPDVGQALSAASADWLDDPGLFDLPYDPGAVMVSFAQAASVAAGWGRPLHAEAAEDVPSYIRRMPANWSDLSPSERRALAIEFVGRRRAPARRGRRPAVVASDEVDSVATERRGDVRVRLAGRAHIRYEHTTISAGLVNLGERGAGCLLPEVPPRVASGATLAGPLLLEVEAEASRICLDVASRISWHRSTAAGTHFGVSFAELSADETEGVQHFLAAAR